MVELVKHQDKKSQYSEDKKLRRVQLVRGKSPNSVRNRVLEFQFGEEKISVCLIGENIKSDSYDFVSKKVRIR